MFRPETILKLYSDWIGSEKTLIWADDAAARSCEGQGLFARPAALLPTLKKTT